ncbi:MAG: phospholipase D family protein [Steroidobacteraceae bacterium]
MFEVTRSRGTQGLRRVACVCVIVLTACAALPEHVERSPSSAYSTPTETNLGRTAAEAAALRAGQSGFLVLDSGKDALLERLALIESAERSIDLQYYIWNSDSTGRYMAARVYAAAERGVRVRILLDDMNTSGRDAVLAFLDSHPAIEVRIYNPIAARSGVGRLFGFARDFSRANRRMHNKSLTADGAATIVGGRNIGDEYFDASAELNFLDRDLLSVGPVVAQVEEAFDVFWNSPWAYPIASLTKTTLTPEEAAARRTGAIHAGEELAQRGFHPVHERLPGQAHFAATLKQLVWAPARLVHDVPPVDGDVSNTSTVQAVAHALAEIAGSAQHEVLIESAYFILGDPALERFAQLKANGVRLRALTNSLASNDLATNHSGYARRREQMLKSGIELHELRPDAASCQVLVSNRCGDGAAFGLHSKSAVFDRRIVYVGSFNVNLRSAYLNTETALIIESPALAEQVAKSIEENMREENSWRVELDEKGHLRWVTARDGVEEISTHEPATGLWRRFQVGFYKLFPVEKYL